ncbi:MFS transporter [Dactylosporangium aurantiacum]|uniref:MFS transporter n=1 Tax=Dactylosporangium aurantiacum TaxID=35754 RepID=A0A9Q9IAV2_9ACTN|nr:MFS transporter [Dactylosporangium aurantiacum]MDG6106889.1 MFS transporter [Dactylosporangium aurantiacum]UWZ51020.1 MFS transporter [Dactylosporangium aurantiacum]
MTRSGSDLHPPAPVPLRHNRDFTVFWTVQALSTLGSSFSLVAIPLLVLHATGSVAQMGLITGIAGAGTVASGLFAGVLVDRADRRLLMIWCDLARLLLYAAVPAVWWTAGEHVWLLYPVIGVASVFQMVFDVACSAAVPGIVAREQLTAANSRLQATYGAGFVLGPMAAGLVAGLAGPVTAIAVDAATFGVSVVGLLLIRVRPVAGASGGADDGRPRAVWQDLAVGVRFLWRTPVLRAITLLYTPVTFLSLGLVDVFIFYVRHDLGQGDRVVGGLLGAASVGSIVAAVITPAVRRRVGFGPAWLSAYLACGAAIAAAGLVFNLAVVLVAAVVFAFGETMAAISSASLRQTVTPEHLLGRVTAGFWMIHHAFGPVGALVLTSAVARVGVHGPLIAVGVSFLAVVAAGLFTPVRARHVQPADR